MSSLQDRIQSYEEISDHKLIKKLPLIIIINGRSFKKTTSVFQKPFDPIFMELMAAVMLKLFQEIDGSIFAYSFNDEIAIALKNDDGWYGNRIQKIVSSTASIATSELIKRSIEKEISLFGDIVFTSKTFVLPSILETINFFISKQQQAFHSSLYFACFFELLKIYDGETVKSILYEKSAQARADLLYDECKIDFQSLPSPFRRGIATYRAPQIIHTDAGEQIKNKLKIDMDLPIFSNDQDFLKNILVGGGDVLRVK